MEIRDGGVWLLPYRLFSGGGGRCAAARNRWGSIRAATCHALPPPPPTPPTPPLQPPPYTRARTHARTSVSQSVAYVRRRPVRRVCSSVWSRAVRTHPRAAPSASPARSGKRDPKPPSASRQVFCALTAAAAAAAGSPVSRRRGVRFRSGRDRHHHRLDATSERFRPVRGHRRRVRLVPATLPRSSSPVVQLPSSSRVLPPTPTPYVPPVTPLLGHDHATGGALPFSDDM